MENVYESIGFGAIPDKILKDLTIARICEPSSKLATIDYIQRYWNEDYHYQQVYRYLDTFVHITPANVHDTQVMDKIPYEVGVHYIFDRGYNDFENLYTINRIEAFFVVRAKTNVRFKIGSWTRRLPENIISDVTGTFTVYKSSKGYPEELRKVIAIDPEDGTTYIFLTNNLEAPQPLSRNFTVIAGV